MNDNKLIAEFMGVKPPLYMEYHTSWDWLMPVVHKIDEECRERFGLNHSLYIGEDIDVVYEAVVEFIKEHNWSMWQHGHRV